MIQNKFWKRISIATFIVFQLIHARNLKAQTNCDLLFVTTSNQTAKPIDINEPYTQSNLLNSIFTRYGVVRYRQSSPYSTRPEAIDEYRIYADGNIDSLKIELESSELFSNVKKINCPTMSTSCSTPVLVSDPEAVIRDNWALNNIEANCAWTLSKGSPRVFIAIADSEFDTTHPDLLGKFTKVWDEVPSFAISPHGTKVSGCALANTNNSIGISSIGYNLKGAGYRPTRLDFWTSIWQAHLDGARVVNLSWSTTGAGGYAEVENLTKEGTVLVVAAGNAADDTDHLHISSIPGVILVSGIDKDNKHGPTGHAHNTGIDLCAPSKDVLTTQKYDGGAFSSDPYWSSTGTSIAAPLVTGTIGLMYSVNPCLSPGEVEYILKQTCDPIVDASSFPGLVGAGRLNAYKAVKMAQETSCMNIGIDINTLCRPGKVSGVPNPQLTVRMEGGTPPYTYKWEPIPYTPGAGIWNTTTLDSYTIGNPTIISSTTLTSGGYHIAYYNLRVTDNSPIKRMAFKKVYVLLSNSLTPIVSMRDSYMDMLKEENHQAYVNPEDINTWTSPDVWNRQVADGIETHENPEHFISAPNYSYTRIHNYGCVASDEGQKLKLYWSKASTGEKWEADWKTTNVKDKFGSLTMPGGREITPSSGISIPALAPAATTIINHSWTVPKPQDYEGEPNSVDVCLLARIEKSETYPHGMTYPETSGVGVGQNVRNNNTIVTRNLVLTNLNTLTKKTSVRQVIVGNGDEVAQTFNIAFEVDRPIYPLFGGDFSTRGSVTLHLGSLYDRWIAGGGEGEFTSRNESAKTVTMQGNSLLQLNNIEFAASERFTIQVAFNLDTTATITDSSFQRMHLRQYLSSKPDSLYGAVGYELRIQPGSQNNQRKTLENTVSYSESFQISPNPTNGILYISYGGEKENATEIVITDITGKKLMTEKVNFTTGSKKEVNLSRFASGVYLINITNANGTKEVYKVVKE